MVKTEDPSSKKQKSKPSSLAALADRHKLYEKSVQAVESEFEFIDENFNRIRGRRPRLLREDFCGTANLCCEWVRQHKENHAIGVDIDAEVLAWGREHQISQLKPNQSKRVALLQEDVLKVKTDPIDVVVAMNFSYQIFKERKQLRGYFQGVRDALAEDGILFLDIFGGYDAFRELKEKTKHKKFTYVWEQAHYNPINGDILCHIHFHFPDGSKMKKAFTYDWRLWTLPEIRELLEEAGFKKSTVYWQGTDKKSGEGNGIFTPCEQGDADAGWICYLSAEK